MSARVNCGAEGVDDGIAIDVAGIFDILLLPSALRTFSRAKSTHGSLLEPDLQGSMSGYQRDESSVTWLPRISPVNHEPLQNPSPVSTMPLDESCHAANRTSDPNIIMGHNHSGPMAKDLILPFNDFFFNPFQRFQQWEAQHMNSGDLLMYDGQSVEGAKDLQTMY